MNVFDDPNIKKIMFKLYSRYPDTIDLKDRFIKDDFVKLHKIRFFLQVIYDTILFIKGHNVILDRVLPIMEFILNHFEINKE